MTRALLNAGTGAWAFEEVVVRLASAFWLDATEIPGDYNYVLACDGPEPPTGRFFIPFEASQVASDKRLQAAAFTQAGISVPETHLLETSDEVRAILQRDSHVRWALKWPTGCGGAGHRLLRADDPIHEDWPRPYVLQRFVELARPEVYRLYCVAGETFGWNVRRFPANTTPSPWVAHARGARYESAGDPPEAAISTARAALEATGLLASFGCVDLLLDNAVWRVLEVGTDGPYGYVDRDIGLPGASEEIDRRLAEAFWADEPSPPWGTTAWHPCA